MVNFVTFTRWRSHKRWQQVNNLKDDAGVRRFDVLGVRLQNKGHLFDEAHLSKNFNVKLSEGMIVPEQDCTWLKNGLHAVRALLVVDGGRVFAPHFPAVENGFEQPRVANERFGLVAKLENWPPFIETDHGFREAVLEQYGDCQKASAANFAAKYSRHQKYGLLPHCVAENVTTGKCCLKDDVEGWSNASVTEAEFNRSSEEEK